VEKLNGTSVVGLGKLGLPFAVCLASKGFQVIGVDIDESKIKAVNNGVSPISETNLQEMLSRHKDSIIATNDYRYALANSNVSFILVDTVSDSDRGYSSEKLELSCREIGKVLRDKDTFHVVVVASTVLPLTCEKKLKPILEKHSEKKCPADFGLCYSPEFIALGSVIHDFLNPNFFLIGESDPKSGQIVENIYRKISNSKIVRTSIVNAELTKIAINCFLTTKISFANTLGEVCEKLPNANADTVTSLLGLDHRISAGCLKAGLGFGGPCFPRDNKAFSFLAKQLGCQSWLAEAIDKVNAIQVNRVIEKVKSILRDKGTVAVLGVSYKPNTEIVEASQSLEIAKKLSGLGYKVKVYDPQAMNEAKLILGDNVVYCNSLQQCVENTDLCIVATPWKEFEHLEVSVPVINCWNVRK